MFNFNVSVYFHPMYAFVLPKKPYKMVDFFCVILTIVKMLVVRVCFFFVTGLGMTGLGICRLKCGLGWAKMRAWLA